MKKILTSLLIAVMLASSFTPALAAATPYDEYTKISGKIERDGSGDIKVGDKVRVNICVNYGDSTPIEKITAFHILGNCSDNLKISSFDFCDASKKPQNTITSKTKDHTIDYLSANTPNEEAVTADSDGFGRLIWVEFEAVSSGTAKIHLDGSYIRTDTADEPQYKRCLSVSDFDITVSSNGSSDDSNDNSGGNGSSSGGSSSRPSGNKGGTSVSGGTAKNDDAKTDDTKTDNTKTDENNGVQPASHNFADVPKDHWAYEYANYLFDRKIISGAGTNESGEVFLNPDSAITREEAVKIAVAAANIALDNEFDLAFADKDFVSDWAKPYVFAGVKSGILTGYGEDNTFRPKNQITREELVKVIVSAFGIEISENADVSAFSDADKITWSAPYIAAAVKSEIIKGYADGSVKPQSSVTRIEAITMFARALGSVK